MMSEIKQIRYHLPGLLFLALLCASCASSGDSTKPDGASTTFPWNVDSMYQDVRSLIHEKMYGPVQKDIDMKILAWRRIAGWDCLDMRTCTVWTALLLVRYRDTKWENSGDSELDGWAYMYVSRDSAGEHGKGHWLSWMETVYGPLQMYYSRSRRLTIEDLDTFMSHWPVSFFGPYVETWQGGLLPILEGHIMVSTWEEVFGEPPKYKFDLSVPPDE